MASWLHEMSIKITDKMRTKAHFFYYKIDRNDTHRINFRPHDNTTWDAYVFASINQNKLIIYFILPFYIFYFIFLALKKKFNNKKKVFFFALNEELRADKNSLSCFSLLNSKKRDNIMLTNESRKQSNRYQKWFVVIIVDAM